jgi:hypothetical protein
LPVVGDWDGNGTTVGVFAPATATFYLRNSNSAGGVSVTPFAFGGTNWKAVAGDWDGNGTTSIGVFSPAGVWYLRNSNAAGGPDVPAFAYGAGTWQPVVGDWDGNGTTTIGVLDPTGKWYLRNSNSAGGPSVTPFAYGAGAWKPLAGDWDFPNTAAASVEAALRADPPAVQVSPVFVTSAAAVPGAGANRFDPAVVELLAASSMEGTGARVAARPAGEPSGRAGELVTGRLTFGTPAGMRAGQVIGITDQEAAWLEEGHLARLRYQRDLDELFVAGW